MRPAANSAEFSSVAGSSSKANGESRAESPAMDDENSDGKDKSSKKKWFNLNLSRSDKKA